MGRDWFLLGKGEGVAAAAEHRARPDNVERVRGISTDAMRKVSRSRRFILLRRGCGCALLVTAMAVAGGFLMLSEELHDLGMWGEWRRSTNRAVPRVNVLTYGCGALFAGTETAGVYRLDEVAERWEPFSRGLTNPEVNDLFVEPSSCSVFAATKGGVLVSPGSDEHSAWEPLSALGSRQAAPSEIAIVEDPRGRFDVLLALAEHGEALFRSLDRGDSWAEVPLPDDSLLGDLSPSPDASGEILLRGRSRVWRSVDAALRWDAVESFDAAGGVLSALVRSGHTSNTVVVCTFEGRCFWSADRGGLWHQTASAAHTLGPLAVLGGSRPTLLAVSLHVRPETPSVFSYSKIHHLRISGTSEESWQEAASPEGLVESLEVHPDQDGRVLAGSTMGVYQSRDRGRTWRPLNRGLGDAVATGDLARIGDRLFVLTDHGKIIYSADGGRTWRQVGPVAPRRPHSLVVDPSTPCRMLRSSYFTLDRSLDCGITWRSLEGPRMVALENAGRGPVLFAVDAQDRNVLRSPDFGDHWNAILEGSVTELAPDPGQDHHLLVVGTELGSPRRDGVAESWDAGRTWRFVDLPAEVRPTSASLWLTESGEVFIGAQGTLWQLEPDGPGWHERLALSQDIQSLVQDPDRKDVLYLCARDRVYGSENRGATWVDLNAPQDDYRRLALVGRGSTLVALTAGQAYTMVREPPARMLLRALLRPFIEMFTGRSVPDS